MRRVVVTGLGAISPSGLHVPESWRSVLEARSGIGPISAFDTDGWPVHVAGEVRGFDPVAHLGRQLVRRTDRFTWFALVAGEEATQDAALSVPHPQPERFGVFLGTGVGGISELAAGATSLREEGRKGISPYFLTRLLPNMASAQLALRFSARGPNVCVNTACAAGNHAISAALQAIRGGDVDLALAGGSEAAITPLAMAGFLSMRALSRGRDQTASRPFDRRRDGFVMGEGAGLLVLEELGHALRRGARIHAELAGHGTSCDAWHITSPEPSGEGAARAMSLALSDAGASPGEVGYLNAHGTSTTANDVTETSAIKAVFGDHARQLAVSSTKSTTGHLLGAAGGLEAVFTTLALRDGVLPPTAHLEEPDPLCDLDYVPGVARRREVRVAMSNAFGFGGTNSSLVFRRWEGK